MNPSAALLRHPRKFGRKRGSSAACRTRWAASKAASPAASPAASSAAWLKPAAAPAASAAPAPVRVGGNIKPPTKTKDVRPVCPSIAQSARVQGVVIIEATIGPDGRVHGSESASVRSRLLDAAALDAVKQWMFTPTTLNGTPVPVIMTVTVNFTLQ